MNVKFHGFKLNVGAVSLDEFLLQFSKTYDNKEFEYRKEGRLLYLSENSDFHLGLLLTARDQRKFCELNNSTKSKSKGGASQNFKVKVRKLAGKNRLVDFNFFIIKKTSGNGLFQHYRGSCGVTDFSGILKKYYDIFRNKKKSELISKVPLEKGKSRKIKAIRDKYKFKLEFVTMLKRDDFTTLVNTMRRVQSFSFTFDTLSSNEPWFTPVSASINSERHTISFSKLGVVGNIKGAISNAVKSNKYKDISVHGDDTNGQPITYRILNNLESFDQIDFDDITYDAALKVSDILNSPIIKRMENIVSNNTQYFR